MSAIWKYCYWLDREKLALLQQRMAAQGKEMLCAKQNPCEILLADIGYTKPETWPLICKHDATPWYRASEHAGKYIVASSFPLDPDFQEDLATTITPVSFTPPRMPTREEQKQLIADKKYRDREPEGWGAFPKEMGDAIVNGLAKMFGAKPEPFADLLAAWTAVHANFVNPVFRADASFENAPYSVTETARISSGCVEFFNLIGSSEEALLVRPCIGAVIVKVFEKDRYYMVRPAKKKK